MRNDDYGPTVVLRGFRKPNGSAAAVYWKPTEILTTAYESTISLDAAELPAKSGWWIFSTVRFTSCRRRSSRTTDGAGIFSTACRSRIRRCC